MRSFVFTKILLFSFVTHSGAAELSLASEPWVEQVYQQLIGTIGDQRREYPDLKLVTTEQAAVRFDAAQDLLLIEKKAIEVCKGLGDAKESAIAFLIAHELTHFYQQHHWRDPEVGFLFSRQTFEQDLEEEREADLYGAFISYLSDYDITLIPDMIKLIYQAYNIRGDKLEDFPSLTERQQVYLEVAGQIDQLVQVYETGNLLFAGGQYGEAMLCYDYLLQFIRCKELYGNLGATALAGAVLMPVAEELSLRYPLSIDLDLPLRDGDSFEREALLNKARGSLLAALEYDPNYHEASINLACTYDITGDYELGIALLDTILNGMDLNALQRERASLTRAIFQAHQGRQEEAEAVLAGLARSAASIEIRDLAEYNHKMLRGRDPDKARDIKTRGLAEVNVIDGMDLKYEPEIDYDHQVDIGGSAGRHYYLSWIDLPRSRLISLQGTGTWVLQQVEDATVRTESGLGVGTSLDELNKNYGEPTRYVFHREGSFAIYTKHKLVFLVNAEGKVDKWFLFGIF